MATKVGINGFGRIGRQVLKAILERAPELEVVAVNDLADAHTNAHLFKYDSNYGTFPGNVSVDKGDLVIGDRRIKVVAEKDPAKLPWKDLGAEIAIESTGRFTDAEKAAALHTRDTAMLPGRRLDDDAGVSGAAGGLSSGHHHVRGQPLGAPGRGKQPAYSRHR